MTKSRYELMFIISPNLGEQKTNKVLDEVREIITSNGGDIFQEDIIGQRYLCYNIKKQNEGYYVIFYINLPGTSYPELDEAFKLNASVFRKVLIKLQDNEEPIKLTKEMLSAKFIPRPGMRLEAAMKKEEENADKTTSKPSRPAFKKEKVVKQEKVEKKEEVKEVAAEEKVEAPKAQEEVEVKETTSEAPVVSEEKAEEKAKETEAKEESKKEESKKEESKKEESKKEEKPEVKEIKDIDTVLDSIINDNFDL